MTVTIERYTGGEPDARLLSDLGEMTADTVARGASIGWMLPPTPAEAARWWRSHLANREQDVWLARDETGRVVGSVTLQWSWKPNARHRGEVVKLMVHHAARGQGIASRLMTAMERQARTDGRTLLLLDTATGSLAERMYRKWGWYTFGVVEGHSLDEHGEPLATTYMLKRLAPPP